MTGCPILCSFIAKGGMQDAHTGKEKTRRQERDSSHPSSRKAAPKDGAPKLLWRYTQIQRLFPIASLKNRNDGNLLA